MLRMPCSSPSDGHFNREHNLIIFHQSVFLVKSCFQEVKVLMVLWNCEVFLWRPTTQAQSSGRAQEDEQENLSILCELDSQETRNPGSGAHRGGLNSA